MLQTINYVINLCQLQQLKIEVYFYMLIHILIMQNIFELPYILY